MAGGKAVLLDSCIVSNLLSKQADLADKTAGYLDTFTVGNIPLYISEYTHYEVLKGANESTKQKAKAILQQFTKVPQTQERLERSASLFTAYQNEPSIKAILHSISDMDILIGALIFTGHKPLLLTADFNGYPRPLFAERHTEAITYKDKWGQIKTQYYYLLEGNTEHLLNFF